MTHTRYAIIGDIHSQLLPLEAALKLCLSERLTPILLGDLFDSRCETSDSVGVYHAVRQIQKEIPGTIILQSNHQNKLIRYLKGNKVKVFQDLRTTIDDFEKGGIDLVAEVLPWLDSMPYGFVYRGAEGTEYRCAHACFPRRLPIPKYNGTHQVMSNAITRRELETMIYGPFYKVTLEDGKVTSDRLPWWLEDDDKEWVRVAGHYHNVYISEKNIVLDGQMGGSSHSEINPEDTKLCLYDVETKVLRYFGHDGRLQP